MPIGPGKYDLETTLIRKKTNALGVILIVFGGTKGHGFSIQAPLEIQRNIPALLKDMAIKIERDVQNLT
ncbi:hypothetical protein LCGC14_1389320 [marine sediment metagenome]|uniref:Uncharacterized protein n=1 Tax=marine sediment metagenome TaxID=412755 RepID=A0A0F9K0M9_9ZZZZ